MIIIIVIVINITINININPTIMTLPARPSNTLGVSTVSTNLERSLEGRRVSTNSTNLERRRVSTSSGTRRLLANFTSNFSNNTSNSSRLSDFSLARSKRGSKRRKSYAGSKCMYEVIRFPFTSFNLTWIVFQLPPFGRHFDPLIHNEYTIR